MDPLEKARQTQIANLQQRSGKTLEALFGLIRESGLSKHGQIRDMLKTTLGMGHRRQHAHAPVSGAGGARCPRDPSRDRGPAGCDLRRSKGGAAPYP